MRIAVVYESMYGNTHAIAESIAAGVRDAAPAASVAVIPTGAAETEALTAADLIVIGGPTHAFRMSTPASRHDAAHPKSGATVTLEPGAEGPGVRDVLDRLGRARPGQRAAAFDTRVRFRFAGGAAPGIDRRLARAGFVRAAAPTGFIVTGTTGPLAPGELERARAYGAALPASLPGTASGAAASA